VQSLSASVEQRRCSNESKTRNPLKFSGVPQTPEPISAAREAEVHHTVTTFEGDIAV